MNIVVLGGGTAGWMSALYINKRAPEYNVVVVESPEIGILGAGEGTTPLFVGFTDELQIPISSLIKEASATIKTGVKFTNWNGDQDYYYHSFDEAAMDFPVDTFFNEYDPATVLKVYGGVHSKDFSLLSKIAEKNKIPHIINSDINKGIKDPIFNYRRVADFAIHFDATQLAVFLKKVALSRGVICVEDTVVEVQNTETGNISKLLLKSGTAVDVDFLFDCSGFKRLIIGGHYKAEWLSYKDYLPVDSAIPFFLPKEETTPPYTEAVAMKYGWMWKIPLQHRYGCGYVYDSSLISEKEAVLEIENYLGFEPVYPRKEKGGFSFNAGTFTTPRINNCIAIGLASGFIEPLEATSIFSSIVALRRALHDLRFLKSNDQNVIDRYNQETTQFNEKIFNFIFFHYLGERNDTLFWKRFKEKENQPLFIQKLLGDLNTFFPRYTDFDKIAPFVYENWVSVGYGIKKLNTDVVSGIVASNNLSKYQHRYDQWSIGTDTISTKCVPHDTFLQVLKNS
jgi:tryptophan halogenase